MRRAIDSRFFPRNKVEECIQYFSSNFGKSRYHHINHFVVNILDIDATESLEVESKILSTYAEICENLYRIAEFTPGILDFLKKVDGKYKYVASGSDQKELRNVFNAFFIF